MAGGTLPDAGAAAAPLEASVVICAYTEERWDQLVDAVRSAEGQTVRPLEVIVAVDHNAALLTRVRTELAHVVAVANAEPRGLSGARNSGVAAASGHVVAFLDDDAVAAPDWLELLLAPYADPHVLGVGGAIEPNWIAGRPAGFPAEFDWVVGCTYAGVPVARSPVRNMIGANMSLRREVFDLVGGFATGMGRVGRLPAGCEETELCIRARQRNPGGEFLFEPRARVTHAVPPARATWRYFRARCFAEGISKAQVAAAAGAQDALSTERGYALRTLPAGIARGLRDAANGDATGLARSAAIAAGLAVTAAGYLVGATREARA